MSKIKQSLAKLALDLSKKEKTFSLGTETILCDIKDSVSTGCTPLDINLSSPSNPKGGLPYGRVIEIYGGESEGKTTLTESIAAQNCKKGGINLFLLCEGSIDKKRLALQGVDLEQTVTRETESIEDGFRSIEEFVLGRDDILKSVPLAVFWDTISQCHPETGNGGMGEIPRTMHEMKRKYTGLFSKSNLLMVFISQVMDSIGGWGGSSSASGGRAIRYWSSVRLELKRKGWIDGKSGRDGIMVGVNLFKSKICLPHRSATVPIKFATGVDDDLAMWHYLKEDQKKVFWTAGPWHKMTTPDGKERSFHFEDLPEIMNEPGIRQYIKDSCWACKNWTSVDVYDKVSEEEVNK